MKLFQADSWISSLLQFILYLFNPFHQQSSYYLSLFCYFIRQEKDIILLFINYLIVKNHLSQLNNSILTQQLKYNHV